MVYYVRITVSYKSRPIQIRTITTGTKIPVVSNILAMPETIRPIKTRKIIAVLSAFVILRGISTSL